MIKYMVVKYAWSISDEWLDIVAQDIPDIHEAESVREHYLEANPSVLADNVSVMQYRE